MAIDFPTAPTVGQIFPVPPVAGQPQYTWDGEKWTTEGGVIIAGSPATALPLIDATPAVVGVATRYAREDHVHPTDTSRAATTSAVLVDTVQSFTAPKQQQGRQNIYAAPFDAMAFNGMQLNGSMEVSQYHGATAVAVAGYVVDGFMVAASGTMGFSASQSTDAPPGYANSLEVTVTTAEASLAAGDYCVIQTRIEGYRVQRLAFGTASAAPLSVGFWIKANRPGLYSGCIRNSASNRSYVFTFTIASSMVWQWVTVTLSGDVTGAWLGGSNNGLQLNIAMAAGATFQGAPGAWSASNFLGATGTTNGVAATSDYMAITGFVLLPGNELPSASHAPLIMRPYDQELTLCQRQLEIWDGTANSGYNLIALGAVTNSNLISVLYPFKTRKRATPVFAYSALTDFAILYNGFGSANALTNLAMFYYGVDGVMIQATGTGSVLPGYQAAALAAMSGTTGKLMFDARL